jgi:hypothetical protein
MFILYNKHPLKCWYLHKHTQKPSTYCVILGYGFNLLHFVLTPETKSNIHNLCTIQHNIKSLDNKEKQILRKRD